MNSAPRVLLILSLFLFGFVADAQVIPIVSKINTPEAVQGQPASISAELSQNQGISRVLLLYRPFGESEFRDIEMLLTGRTATATIPAAAVTPPYIEYFIRVEMIAQGTETYPIQNPELNPLKLFIKEANPKDQEVRILSPEAGQTLTAEDLGIAVSLFYASDAVDRAATHLYLDGVDVTAQAVFSDDMILYSPANFNRPLNLGTHFLRVELRDTTGKVYHTVEESFNLSTSTAIQAAAEEFQLRADGRAELRNESLVAATTNYARGELRLRSTYKGMNFGGTLYLDNQDKPDRQPQNRFSIFGETSFLRLQGGDSYPTFPSLLMSGKRIRGFSGNLALGFFNLDVTAGQGSRSIEGTVDSTVAVSSEVIPSLPNNTKLVQDTIYSYFSQGTYARNFLVVRPSFGSGENFQLGLTYMRAKDDVGSIQYGITPQDNVVAGTDLLIAFDDQRVKLTGQASIGLINKDISEGGFTDADYDSLEAQNEDLGKALKKIRPIAEKLITVNSNLFPTNPVSSGLPGVAFESMFSLNYLGNFLQAGFYRRGAAYISLGNEYLQTDVQGFVVSDRIRMFENRAFLSVSYEQKHDNTANTKPETITFSNLNTSLTVLPVGFPGFTIGYGRYGLLSDRLVGAPNVPDSLVTVQKKSVDDATNRFFIGSNYDFDALARQSLALNFSIALRNDNSFYNRDQNNLYFQASLTTTYSIPMQTTVGVLVSQNTTQSQLFTPAGADSILQKSDFSYTTLTAGVQYRLFRDDLRLAFVVAPSFGAIERTSVQVGIDYALSDRHSLEFLFNYMQNAGYRDDSIAGLTYRFSF